MKRRAFIQSISATSLLGLGGWSSASAAASKQASLQPLTPVFEHLPQVMVDAKRWHQQTQASFADSERERGKSRFELRVDEDDYSNYPLLIGLGPRAEHIIDQIKATAIIPEEAGLYRTGQPAQQEAPNWLAQRLQKTSAVMLLIDPDDRAARDDARVWARQLIEDEVYLSVALVLETQQPASDPSWQAKLGLPVVQVCADNAGLDTTAIVSAMLPGLPFNRPTLVGVDPIDVRTLLNAGYRAWTTAVYSPPSEDCIEAIARASANLPPFTPAGALAWVTTSLDFSIGEFDTIGRTLRERTDHRAAVIHVPFLDPSYAEGERLLSLTFFGD